jgi:hypothetical protein
MECTMHGHRRGAVIGLAVGEENLRPAVVELREAIADAQKLAKTPEKRT